MLKKIVNRLAHLLRLKKRKPVGSGIDTLLELLPYIFLSTLLLGVLGSIERVKHPWHKRLRYKIRFWIWKVRTIVIGY